MYAGIKTQICDAMLVAAAFIGKLPANLHSKLPIIMKYIFQVIMNNNFLLKTVFLGTLGKVSKTPGTETFRGGGGGTPLFR